MGYSISHFIVLRRHDYEFLSRNLETNVDVISKPECSMGFCRWRMMMHIYIVTNEETHSRSDKRVGRRVPPSGHARHTHSRCQPISQNWKKAMLREFTSNDSRECPRLDGMSGRKRIPTLEDHFALSRLMCSGLLTMAFWSFQRFFGKSFHCSRVPWASGSAGFSVFSPCVAVVVA